MAKIHAWTECNRLGFKPEAQAIAMHIMGMLDSDPSLTLIEVERQIRIAVCLEALERAEGIKQKAMLYLRIHRTTLVERLRKVPGMVIPKREPVHIDHSAQPPTLDGGAQG